VLRASSAVVFQNNGLILSWRQAAPQFKKLIVTASLLLY
jgi:hypothetical protein